MIILTNNIKNMNDKQTKDYLKNMSELFRERLAGLERLSNKLTEFPYETMAEREEFVKRLHSIQAILVSPEIQKSTEEEDMAVPSEGAPWHYENVDNN